MKNKTKGIIGSNGFVGKILKRYYPDAIGYDINGECDELEQVMNCDIIFVAINLIDNCISDKSKDILCQYFERMKTGTIVVIKSTFVPGSLDWFRNKFSELIFVYNPEFLTEMTAWEDFSNPTFQILGCAHEALPLVHELFEIGRAHV